MPSTSYCLVPDTTMMQQEQKGLTWPLLLALFASTFGSSFVFGHHVGVMNAPTELIKGWIANESYPSVHGSLPSYRTMTEIWSWIIASFHIGGIFGGLLCGYLSDKLGRKGALLANDVLALAGALLLGISKVTNLYFLLLAGRIVIGISCSISSSTPAIYLTEIAPLRLRGVMGSLNSFFVILGIFLSQVLGLPQLLGTETLWPFLLAFSAAPTIFQMIVLPFCVESPKYLLSIKNDPAAARAVLVKLRQTEDVTEEFNSMLDEGLRSTKGECIESTPSRTFWWGVSICMANHAGQHLSGAVAVLFFSATIFTDQAQMTNQQAVGATLGVGAVFLLSSVISTAIMDRVGRRLLMLSGLAGSLLFDVMIFVALHLLAIDSQKFHVAAYAAVVFVYLYIFTFTFGPASIPWFYTSELFEPQQRGRANMIATTTNWTLGFVMGYTFLPLKDCMGEYVFLLYAGAVSAAFVYIYLFAPETKGRQCKGISKELESKMPRCIR